MLLFHALLQDVGSRACDVRFLSQELLLCLGTLRTCQEFPYLVLQLHASFDLGVVRLFVFASLLLEQLNPGLGWVLILEHPSKLFNLIFQHRDGLLINRRSTDFCVRRSLDTGDCSGLVAIELTPEFPILLQLPCQGVSEIVCLFIDDLVFHRRYLGKADVTLLGHVQDHRQLFLDNLGDILHLLRTERTNRIEPLPAVVLLVILRGSMILDLQNDIWVLAVPQLVPQTRNFTQVVGSRLRKPFLQLRMMPLNLCLLVPKGLDVLSPTEACCDRLHIMQNLSDLVHRLPRIAAILNFPDEVEDLPHVPRLPNHYRQGPEHRADKLLLTVAVQS
mmetsp:Transcript_128395/g.411558  ORF Transcript_128395/g.411558 Transcript_128395/m.411558 type:complete len:333 (+) Transcript_128395:2149-3147(+)